MISRMISTSHKYYKEKKKPEMWYGYWIEWLITQGLFKEALKLKP